MSYPANLFIGNTDSQTARSDLNNIFEYFATTGAGRTDVTSPYTVVQDYPNSLVYNPSTSFRSISSQNNTLLFTKENAGGYIEMCIMDQTNERVDWLVGDYKIKQTGTTLDFVNSSGATVMRLTSTGNLSIAGTLTQNATL